MIPLLVAQPITEEGKIERPPPERIVRERASRLSQTFEDSLSEDEKYVCKLLAWIFMLLVLPAILTLVFIALNPDAFMIDVTPKRDF